MVCFSYFTKQPKAVNPDFLLIWWDSQAQREALFGSQAQRTCTWRKKGLPRRSITPAVHTRVWEPYWWLWEGPVPPPQLHCPGVGGPWAGMLVTATPVCL